MKHLQLVLALLMAMTFSLNAFFEEEEEEDYPIGIIKEKNGVSVYSNANGNYFTFFVPEKNTNSFIKDKNFFLDVDGDGMQINVVYLSEFLSAEEIKKELNEKDILKKYQKFEVQYIENAFNEKLNVTSKSKKLKSGRQIMVWSFEMPKKFTENVVKQLFMTTVVRKHVLILNGIIVKEGNEEKLKDLLEICLNTLELKKKATIPPEDDDNDKKVKGDKKSKKAKKTKENMTPERNVSEVSRKDKESSKTKKDN